MLRCWRASNEQVLKLLKRHPNIIRMYEAFKRKGRLHVAFEYFPRNLLEVSAEPLADRNREVRRFG